MSRELKSSNEPAGRLSPYSWLEARRATHACCMGFTIAACIPAQASCDHAYMFSYPNM